MGAYKRKNHYDIWVQADALGKSSLCSYPVAGDVGTASALKLLYGIPANKSLSPKVLAGLLNHSFHQLKATSAFVGKCDSLASLSMTLCFWHASLSTHEHNGKTVDGLARHVLVQETETLELLAESRQTDLGWDLGVAKL